MRVVLLLLVACATTAHVRVPRRTSFQGQHYHKSRTDNIHAKHHRNYQDEENCVEDLMQVESKVRFMIENPPGHRGFRRAKDSNVLVRVPRSLRVSRQVYDYVQDPIEKPICITQSETSTKEQIHIKPYRPPTPGIALYQPHFPNLRHSGHRWITQEHSFNHGPYSPQVQPHHYNHNNPRVNQPLYGVRYNRHPGNRYMHQNWPNLYAYQGMMPNIHMNEAEKMQPTPERHQQQNVQSTMKRGPNMPSNRQSSGRQSNCCQSAVFGIQEPMKVGTQNATLTNEYKPFDVSHPPTVNSHEIEEKTPESLKGNPSTPNSTTSNYTMRKNTDVSQDSSEDSKI